MGSPDQDCTVTDSPAGWVARHIREYVETDGRTGARRWGTDILLLTTRGRKTGLLRRTALIYGMDGDRYLVVPSNGGSAKHPAWFLNLLADPKVEVQVMGDMISAVARVATDEEKPRLWDRMVSAFPTYRTYQTKTKRVIPVVIIERADD